MNTDYTNYTNYPTIPMATIRASRSGRVRRRSMIAIGATAAIAIATSSAVVRSLDEQTVRPEAPAATRSDYAALRDLVNRGVIPREALYPAPMTDDELRDLVNRGVIPRQALEPAAS